MLSSFTQAYPHILVSVFIPFVSDPLKKRHRSVLSLFEQFLMVLMKFHLNLCDKDLAFRFGVSQSAVSKNFWKWIYIVPHVCVLVSNYPVAFS